MGWEIPRGIRHISQYTNFGFGLASAIEDSESIALTLVLSRRERGLSEKKAGLERTYKPGSVPLGFKAKGDDHFSRASIVRRLKRSTRKSVAVRTDPRQAAGRTSQPALRCSLLDLAPGGVCRARPVARPAGELLPRHFTLTSRRTHEFDPMRPVTRRYAFCCTFPDLSAGGRYPSPRPTEPGLSSRRNSLLGRYGGPPSTDQRSSGLLQTQY